jgi:serine/threonine protein kinase
VLCPQCNTQRPDNAEPCPSCGAVSDPFIGRVLQDKFEIRKRLGQGGFGAVYEAYHRELESKVAVKTLHAGLAGSNQAVERFKREALATSKLQSPHVVKVFDRGSTPDGILWLAMEYVQGENLGDRIKRQKYLTEREFIEIFGPICEALQEAHSKGIIHRDLKPDNIMLTTLESGKPFPKILDFGIAALRTSDGSLTQSGTISGTPKYMAPEQWEGLKRTDPRSDIYSLGIIAYQCLSGNLPFSADSTFGWMKLHYNASPKPLREQMGERPLSKQTEAAVMKAIEKKPEHRFSSTLEFFQALSGEAPVERAVKPLSAPASFGDAHTADLAPTLQEARSEQEGNSNATMSGLSLEGAAVAMPSGLLEAPKKRSRVFWGSALLGLGLLGGGVYSQLSPPTKNNTPQTKTTTTTPTAKSQPSPQATLTTKPSSVRAITAAELATKEQWALAAETESDPALVAKYKAEADAQRKLELCKAGDNKACQEIPADSRYFAEAQTIVEKAAQKEQSRREDQLSEVNAAIKKGERASLEKAKRTLDSLMKDKAFAQANKLSELKRTLNETISKLPPTAEELRAQILNHKAKNEPTPLCNKFRLYKTTETNPAKVEELSKLIDDGQIDFGLVKACSGLFH